MTEKKANAGNEGAVGDTDDNVQEHGVSMRYYVVDEGAGLAPPDLPTVTVGLREDCEASFGCGATLMLDK